MISCPLNSTPTATNSSELQRLTEDVAEVKESIKDLSKLLQDQLTQILESLGGLSKAISSLNYCNNDDDETLTFSKLASPAQTNELSYCIVKKYLSATLSLQLVPMAAEINTELGGGGWLYSKLLEYRGHIIIAYSSC